MESAPLLPDKLQAQRKEEFALTPRSGFPACPGTARHSRIALYAAVLIIGAVLTPNFVISLMPQRIYRATSAADAPPEYPVLDFALDWTSARNLFAGQSIYRDLDESVYDFLGFRRNLSDPTIYYSFHFNAKPPTSVLLAVPFAWMDYPNAFLAWNLVSLGLFMASVWLVVRQLGLRVTLLGLAVGCVLVLLCGPFRGHVHQGRLDIVLLALITGAWAAERTDRPGRAGVLLGLATAIKLFPGFLLVYYAVRGRWRVVLAGIASLLACTALTLMVVGVDTYTVYVRDVIPQAEEQSDFWNNASLPGLFAKLFAAPHGHITPLVRSRALRHGMTILCDVILGVVLLTAMRRSRRREDHDLTFSLAVVTMLLVAPITWDSYLLLLLVPFALLWARLPRLGHWRWLFFACLVASWLPPKIAHGIFSMSSHDPAQSAKPWQVISVLSLQCYALLGLFALIAALVWRERCSSIREAGN